MAEGKDAKKRSIFILYIPGGAVLGIIPSMILSRLEELTETPAIHLFQATDGVSTGGLIAGGMNVRNPKNAMGPKFTAPAIFDKFRELSPLFFPEIPQRYYKMVTANAINVLEDLIDPHKADALILREIEQGLQALADAMPEQDKDKVKTLGNLATEKWFSNSDRKKALKLCDTIRQEYPQLSKLTGDLSEPIFVRETNGILSSAFKKGALMSMGVAKTWARDFLFDPKVPETAYRDLYGEARMSDCLRTTYITTYNSKENGAQTFYCLKSDFFSLDPATPAEVSKGNHKILDAVMASTANPFAFPPHNTEDGMVCVDKAIVHTPLRCVLDVLARKPSDTIVKLVVLGTGRYITTEKDSANLCEEYARYGVLGNFMRGQETAELQNFVMSQANDILQRSLGEENIIELSPRLSPRTFKELDELPSRSPLDATTENIQKIVNRTKSFMWEEDAKIRELALMLAENLYNIGQMDPEKFERIKEKIHAPCDREQCSSFSCITGIDPTPPQPPSSPAAPTSPMAQKVSSHFSIKASTREMFSRFFGKSASEQDSEKTGDTQIKKITDKKNTGTKPREPM